MKARISEERRYFKFQDMQKAESAMCITWNQLRDDLCRGDFSYNDLLKAKERTFLSVFDSLFIENKGAEIFEIKLTKVFKDYHVVRGSIIKHGEPTPRL